MVRFIIVVLLVLFGVSAMGQTDPGLDSIGVAVREQIGAASTYSVMRAINRAYQQVCTDYPAYELVDTLQIDSTNGFVAVAADFDRVATVDLLSEEDDRNIKLPLRWLDLQPVDSQAHYLRADMDKSNPLDQKYYRIYSGDLYTYPRWTRDDTANFEVRYYAIGTALSAGSDEIEVAEKFYNAVFWLACAELQARRGRWQESAYYEALVLRRYGPPNVKTMESSK